MTAPPPIIPPRAGQAQPDLEPATRSDPTPGTGQPDSASEKRPLELTRADFGEWDWDFIVEAFYPVMAQVHDIQFHRMADTDWTPWAQRGDTPELIAECRSLLSQLEAPIKAARRQIAVLEGTARLRARRRITNGPDLTRHTVTTEASLACCHGEHYADPGMAYIHDHCSKLLHPWGDAHPHALCTCYDPNPESRLPLILLRAVSLLNEPQWHETPAAKAIATAVTELVPFDMRPGLLMQAVRAVATQLELDTERGALAVFAWWERRSLRADVIEALENTAAAALVARGEA